MKALLRKRVVEELPHSVCQWFISLKLCETCIPPGLWADLVQSVRHHKNSLKLSGLSPFKNFMKFVLTTRAAEHFFSPNILSLSGSFTGVSGWCNNLWAVLISIETMCIIQGPKSIIILHTGWETEAWGVVCLCVLCVGSCPVCGFVFVCRRWKLRQLHICCSIKMLRVCTKKEEVQPED